MEDTEIDLRPLLRALLRGWPLMLIPALVFALGAGIVATTRTPQYSAQSDVAILPVTTQVNLESRITQQQAGTDPAVLRSILIGVAEDSTLAQEVIASLGEKLPLALRDPMALQSTIQVPTRGNISLIQVQAITDDPNTSKLIATAWGRAFTQRTNLMFGKQTSIADVERSLAQARTDYLARQNELAQSTLPAEVAQLQRDTKQLDGFLSSLRTGPLVAISNTLVQLGDQPTVPLNAERKARADELDALQAQANRLRELLNNARALRDQVQKGSATGTGLTYSLLLTNLFSGMSDVPTGLQVQTSNEATPTLADLDTLVSNTEARIKQTDEQITALAGTFSSGQAYAGTPASGNGAAPTASGAVSPEVVAGLLATAGLSPSGDPIPNTQIDALEAKYRQKLTELQQKDVQLRVLTDERDQAQKKYAALSTRTTELQTAAGDDTLVRIVGEGRLVAVGQGTTRLVGGALLSGLLLGMLFVVLRFLLAKLFKEGEKPTIKPRAIPTD